jgi:hypothetical protein
MIKYPRPHIEGGLFLSNEEFMNILDQVVYPSALYDTMESIIMNAFPSLTAQLPKRQLALLKKLDKIKNQTKNDQE